MLAFLKEDIETSREHELKLFKLLFSQDGYSSHLSILERRRTLPICPRRSALPISGGWL